MIIPVRVESQYGNLRRFVTDETLADTLRQLTGSRTLTASHVAALTALGHQVVEVQALGRKIAR